MIWNAEFRRNIWLEINFTRLIAFPLVLALVFWAFFTSRNDDPFEAVSTYLEGIALILFGAITVLWGAQLASNSIAEEAQGQTWNWQRLSAQHPATLVIGKLFGSTVLAWYGGLCCLFAYCIVTAHSVGGIKFNWILLAISTAIFAQATAMLLALTTPPEQRLLAQQRYATNLARVFAVVLSLGGGALLRALWGSDADMQAGMVVHTVSWYGGQFNRLSFATISSVIWAGWGVFGCVQRISTLLRNPTTPMPWLLFCFFSVVYFTGFSPSIPVYAQANTHYYGQSAFAVIFGCMAGIALLETKAPLQWRLWLNAWRSKQYLRAWQRTPRWITTFIFSLPILLFALANGDPVLRGTITVLPLMFIRDMTVLYWFHWTPQPRRPYLAFAIYLLLVYLVIPFLLNPLNWLFYPNPNSPMITLGIFIVETAVAVAFLIQRWQAYYTAEFTRNEEEENLQQSLIENEKVIYRARVSIGTQAPLFLLGLGIIAVGLGLRFYLPDSAFKIFNYSMRDILLSLAIIIAIGCWVTAVGRNLLARHHTKLTFTNKRVIVKIGFPLQQNIELPLSKIGSIQVSQTQRGRWFNYGNLVISSIGNPQVTVPDIANPSAFRRTLMEAQEHK